MWWAWICPFDEPKHSDLVVQNDGERTPLELVEEIERAFGLTHPDQEARS